MKKEQVKKDGPSCACGKEELFEVWVKTDKYKKENLSSIKKENKNNTSIDTITKTNN